jgi:hypothetical protein
MFQASPHPRRKGFSPHPRRLRLLLTLAFAAALPAAAQYPGRALKADQKKPDEPRAVSILEWVGDPGKPVASRIVPLSVFINGEYQDGGLYLAQPAPLSVETDTLYQLEQAGVAKGTFYVAGGEEVAGAWFGYGKWKPLAPPPPPKKLKPSKDPPKVVEDNDLDRPHLKNSSPPPSDGSAADPDKPTMHRRADSDGGGTGSGGTADDDPDKPTLHRRTDADPQTASGAGTAPDDPDRPHLRKRSEADKEADTEADADGSPVSSVNAPDPDRPKLTRGKPTEAMTPLEATKLTGLPPDLQQMAAVSDPRTSEEHPFAYPWPDPDEAAKMQAAVEQLAVQAVLSGGDDVLRRIGPAPSASVPRTRGGARSTLARAVPPKPPPVALSDKDFRAYELAYNGGATLVFTAKAAIGPNNAGVTVEKYVTVIAQPDFNGDPQPRLESVTDAEHLDVTPRMRLIDAVDTDGDGRAELIFELRRASDRQFAIYKVRGVRAEQAFATESLPYVTPSHPVAASKAN